MTKEKGLQYKRPVVANVTQELLKEFLHYEPDTGKFFWIRNGMGRTMRKGAEAGSLDPLGYFYITLKGKRMLAHRLAYLYVNGYIPDLLDHANGIPSDNRIENIRKANKSKNAQNTGISRRNTSGAKGVSSYSKRPGVFNSRVVVNGKTICLGSHLTVDEAAHAYNKASIKYFGEFAVLNPIGEDYDL